MKAIFKRKKTEQYHPEGFAPELDKTVYTSRIALLEQQLKWSNEANARLMDENKRLIAKNLRLATLADDMRKEFVKLATHCFGVVD